MDHLFEILKASGGNNVGAIIDLLKQSHILDPLQKEMEGRVRDLFKDALNPNDISLDKFKEVITQVADEQGKSVDEITDQIVAAGTDNLNFDDGGESVAESAAPSGAPSEAQSEAQSVDSG